ncbi:MAG: hypothetical protein ACRDSH_15555, partial [Pseudonocardiaceae bacterium]
VYHRFVAGPATVAYHKYVAGPATLTYHKYATKPAADGSGEMSTADRAAIAAAESAAAYRKYVSGRTAAGSTADRAVAAAADSAAAYRKYVMRPTP